MKLTLLIIATLLFITIIYFKWCYNYWKRKGILSFSPWVVMKKAFTSNSVTFKEFLDWYYKETKSLNQKHMGLYIGLRPYYMPIDLDIIHHILVKDFKYFTDRIQELHENDTLGRTLPFIPGRRWKSIKTKISPIFNTRQNIQHLLEIVNRHGLSMKNHVEKLASKNESLDCELIAKSFILDISGECFLGISCNSFSSDYYYTLFGKMFHYDALDIMKLLLVHLRPEISKYIPNSLLPRATVATVQKLVSESVKRREETPSNNQDVLQHLIDLKNEEHVGFEKLSMGELLAQAAVLFGAAQDTAAEALSFACYELANNKHIQDRVRKEMEEVLRRSEENISYDTLNEMEYLTCVIKETLRKYAPLPLIFRVCVQRYEVPGTKLVIEKGTPLFIPVTGIHGDPDLYPNPDLFDPDRFLDENLKDSHPCAYLPLGAGPRGCPAYRFGILMIKIGLINIMRNYELSLNERTKYPTKFALYSAFLSPREPLLLNVKKM